MYRLKPMKGRAGVSKDFFKVPRTRLTGKWITTNESMSEISREYQKFITGTDKVWLENGVKFDGMSNGTLVDAKAKYGQFVNKNTGQFYYWFEGAEELVKQAQRQINASNGATINWYFMDQPSLNATKALFKQEGISGINLIFKPMN